MVKIALVALLLEVQVEVPKVTAVLQGPFTILFIQEPVGTGHKYQLQMVFLMVVEVELVEVLLGRHLILLMINVVVEVGVELLTIS